MLCVNHSNTRINYNPFRNAEEDFLKCVNNIKIDTLVIDNEASIQKKIDAIEFKLCSF